MIVWIVQDQEYKKEKQQRKQKNYNEAGPFRYSEGGLPFFCLNSREKYSASPYPTDLAISLTGRSVSFNRLHARRIR